jgi:hypothetical protein
MKKNVMCLGLSKTGTTSTKDACLKLGIPVSCSGDSIRFTNKVSKALADGKKILSPYKTPGFFSNLFLPANVIGMDPYYTSVEWKRRMLTLVQDQYPETYFILTIRPIRKWLDSRKRHVALNRTRTGYMKRKKRWSEVDENAWIKEFGDHIDVVTDTVRNLLILDVTSGDGYDKLCPFLGVKPVNFKFPHANKSRTETVR